MNTAKNYISGALLRSFDGAFAIGDRLKTGIDLYTPESYYSDYFNAIRSMKAEELKEIANNYFQFTSLKYCLAGEP